MDFNSAIVAHAQWKVRLTRVIAGEESVDPAVVSRDDVCPLGQWIHQGEARTSLRSAS